MPYEKRGKYSWPGLGTCKRCGYKNLDPVVGLIPPASVMLAMSNDDRLVFETARKARALNRQREKFNDINYEFWVSIKTFFYKVRNIILRRK